MRKILAVLYTSLAISANVAAAEGDGGMSKLTMQEAPVAVPDHVLFDLEGGETDLSALQGNWVLVNFWATWCAPCRAEMPALDRLQAAMPDLVVLPVATGRNAPEAIQRFWEEAGIVNMTTVLDPKSGLSRQMGIAGLPVTVILNPDGMEVARLIGDAEWDSPAATEALKAMMNPD